MDGQTGSESGERDPNTTLAPPNFAKPAGAMALAASSAIAFNGLCMAIAAAFLVSFLSQSSPGAIHGAVQAPPQADADPAAQAIPLAAVPTFFTGVTLIHVHLRHGGGRRMIPEAMVFILCASISLLEQNSQGQQ
ncbi:hypothetical protein HU200_035414 [Digitaria exilis]|uniref:Uncharacterized protein n=1 Tax=Digitaria exilis TaxID=1010633 RepID=A0A835BED2_9POAL|nr:hypothetical protein HU200_037356 [Digitaria exilis]KAF8697917.1 hypothetical protein HU200_035414 [Digitaria exilis]